MRDLFVTICVIASLPFCLARPWLGIVMWSWLGYMSPHRMAFGFSRYMPFAEMVAFATFAGLFFNLRERRSLPLSLPVFLMASLWLVFALSTLFDPINPDRALVQLQVVSKILLMTFLTLFLMQDRQRLYWLVLVIALSIGFHGAKGGMWAVVRGTQQNVLGPQGTFLSDNNDLALALNMVLPFLVFLRRDETRRWVRHGLLAIFFFSVVGVLMTYSRGGFLGLVTVLVLTFLKGRRKVVVLALCAIAVPVVVSILPGRWFERMQTIPDYEEDGSARGRLVAWQLAWRLALDHPVLGAGFKAFTRETYASYGIRAKFHDVHSAYFQMLAEQGFLGFGLFVSLIAVTIVNLRKLRRESAAGRAPPWIGHYAEMLEISLAGYLVSGAFLGRAYFDLFYHVIAIAVVLKTVAVAEQVREVQTVPSRGRALTWPRARALPTATT